MLVSSFQHLNILHEHTPKEARDKAKSTVALGNQIPELLVAVDAISESREFLVRRDFRVTIGWSACVSDCFMIVLYHLIVLVSDGAHTTRPVIFRVPNKVTK